MTAPGRAGPRLPLVVLAIWAFAALLHVALAWDDILVRRFSDADDQMRLLEVRDWLAGQSWFDVAQHRLNGGDFPMHWSRLVDLLPAGVIVLLRPLLGAVLAEHVMLVVVPLLTLLAAMLLIALITRRLSTERAAIAAALLVVMPGPLMWQMRPLRIDHHGWQVVLTLVAAHAMVGRPTARNGAIAGAALAALLTISLEGMPIVAAMLGVASLGWALQPARGASLRTLGLTLAGTAALLHLATRGPGFWAPACDAVAPAWLAVLAVAGVGLTLARLATRFGTVARLGAVAFAGLASGGTLLALAPQCLAGPFATLPPIVYHQWYVVVLEGRPLWEQEGAVVLLSLGLPAVGLIGGALAWRDAAGTARERWTIMLALFGAATMVAILVLRASATANALAMPGAGVLLARLFVRARAIPHVLPRFSATLGLGLLAAPGAATALAFATVTPSTTKATTAHRPVCDGSYDMRALAALPVGTIFAPIDLSPGLLVDTRHRAIAGGYHRSPWAMARVMIGFGASPAPARAVILASRADYLAACPGTNEMERNRRRAPNGLWARLERGERFDWLQPLPIRGPALAWRIIRPLPEGRSAP
ncbi:hypothetical protein [Sphingomonas endophytica]|uniref:hypothetical protein n=1 Tax=Sphingomonas endophytica TaxID=869719 RepID=UPI0007363DF5|nr:hypothetical protein [Sphingomonas endophytica]